MCWTRANYWRIAPGEETEDEGGGGGDADEKHEYITCILHYTEREVCQSASLLQWGLDECSVQVWVWFSLKFPVFRSKSWRKCSAHPSYYVPNLVFTFSRVSNTAVTSTQSGPELNVMDGKMLHTSHHITLTPRACRPSSYLASFWIYTFKSFISRHCVQSCVYILYLKWWEPEEPMSSRAVPVAFYTQRTHMPAYVFIHSHCES